MNKIISIKNKQSLNAWMYENWFSEFWREHSQEFSDKYTMDSFKMSGSARTTIGRYKTSCTSMMLDLMKQAGVVNGTKVLDCGSGIGTSALAMSDVLGSNVLGIEGDSELVSISNRFIEWVKENKGVGSDSVPIINEGDFTSDNFDFSEYEVVFYYNYGSFTPEKLEQKVIKEMKPGSRFVIYGDYDYDLVPFKDISREWSKGKVANGVIFTKPLSDFR
jgi:protein-L-isoaspartate O-methyltransferase